MVFVSILPSVSNWMRSALASAYALRREIGEAKPSSDMAAMASAEIDSGGAAALAELFALCSEGSGTDRLDSGEAITSSNLIVAAEHQ